jgi:hypothetical protein
MAQNSSTEALFEARRSAAKARFEQGVEAYRSHRYAQAVRWFLEADRLAPSPALSYNIARAYDRIDDTSAALRWYRDYLRRGPDTGNASEVRARVTALSTLLSRKGFQQLSLMSAPTGADVSIDGREVGVTPYTGEFALGVHRVVITLKGHREVLADVKLLANEPKDFSVNLQPSPDYASVSAASFDSRSGAERRSPTGPRRFGVAPWIVLGSGAALLGGGLVFELLRRSEEAAAAAAESQVEFKARVEAMERQKKTASILVVVGGGVLATGGILVLLNRRSEASSPGVALTCGIGGCAATARGTF